MFVSKRTLLCALLVCPLVVRVSGNTALRGDRRGLVEANKQPARTSGVGTPVPAAAASSSQAAPLPPPAPLAGIPPPTVQARPPAPSSTLPPSSQNTTSPGVATEAPKTPTRTGPQQQKPAPSPPPPTVAQQQTQLPPTFTTPTSTLPKAQGNPPHASQNEPTVIKSTNADRAPFLGGGGGWPISTVAPAVPALIEGRCEVMTPRVSLQAEPSCGLAFPTFVTATTDAYWALATEPQREAVMDRFCQTGCGETYTGTLLSQRRGCNPPTPRGRMAAVPGGPQVFPPTFPGLRLGCVIDPEDGQYCAIKLASPADGDCEFYKSCCYGELAMTTDGNAPEVSFYDMLDRRCPGSAAYRNKPCLYHQNAAVAPTLAVPAVAAAPAVATQGMAQQGMAPQGPAPPLTYTPAAQAGMTAPAQPFPVQTAAAPLQGAGPLPAAAPASPAQTSPTAIGTPSQAPPSLRNAPPLPVAQQAAAVGAPLPAAAAPLQGAASPLPLVPQALAVPAMAGPAAMQPATPSLPPAVITVPVLTSPIQTEVATERDVAVPAGRHDD